MVPSQNDSFNEAQQLASFASSASGKNDSPKRKIFIVSLTIAVIALAVISLAYFGLKKGKSADESAPSPSASTSAASTPSAAKSSASADPVTEREAEIAKKHTWVANQDFIASQGESGRKAIATTKNYTEDSGRAYGSDNAPVTVHIFTDFSCPICTQFERETLPKLKEVADSGDIRIVWHNFTIFASDYSSDLPARGALAAAQQGKMWEFVQAVYSNLGEVSGHPSYTDDAIIGEAQKLGLDMEKFKKDYKDEATISEVKEEYKAAASIGLNGTPTIFIGNAYASGSPSFKVLSNTIAVQKELAQG